MRRYFTLEYWIDDAWYVGKLREVPGVFSQGENLEELIENVQDAYQLLLSTEPSQQVADHQLLEIEVQV